MLNRVEIIGNLGADPEIRSFNNGGRVANLKVATTERWKDKSGEKKEHTEWHNVSVFSDGLVSVIEKYVSKGSRIYVGGKLQTRKWQDQNGNDRYSTEIVCQGFDSKIILLDGKNNTGTQAKKQDNKQEEILDDDIPF